MASLTRASASVTKVRVVRPAVALAVGVEVLVGEEASVAVAANVGVAVSVGVGVKVSVGVAVSVAVGVGVAVSLKSGDTVTADTNPAVLKNKSNIAKPGAI